MLLQFGGPLWIWTHTSEQVMDGRGLLQAGSPFWAFAHMSGSVKGRNCVIALVWLWVTRMSLGETRELCAAAGLWPLLCLDMRSALATAPSY